MAELAGAATMGTDCGSGSRMCSTTTAHRSAFRVAGVSVEVASERSDDVTLVASLEPFCIQTDCPDMRICVEWADSLSEMSRNTVFDSGSIWRLFQHEDGFQFDFSTPVMAGRPYKRLFVDDSFRRARLQMNEECFAGKDRSAVPLEYPLDELLIVHRLTQEKAIELHGCGIVGPDLASNLFVGHSGAGKSTTARLWTTREDVEVLSDDRIIVRKGAGKILMYGTPWHGEAAFASPASAPLSRICILEHGQGNVLTRLSPSQAVAELFARSFVPFHRHEYLESALEFLQEVVEAIPVYRYLFEPDQGAVETILNLHD